MLSRRAMSTAAATWSRLVRFQSASSSEALVGEPVDPSLDVGIATFEGKPVEVNVYSGKSILNAGSPTGEKAVVSRLLSPLAEHEVGTIRCIGLNYARHAEEANLPAPKVPVLFMKPATSLSGPHPDKIIVPKFTVEDGTADYESELLVIIGKDAKDVSEESALSYVLGYSASNDVSSRKSQFDQSQWCFSKGFDKACPIGPAVISTSSCPDPSKLRIRGIRNGKVVQESGIDDLIFTVPQLVSFLSKGTTLKAGTIILTGTPAGVGFAMKPAQALQDGDDFRVEVSGGVGTLINIVEYEK